MDHSDDLWAELFPELYADEFGGSGCSPFPECQASPYDMDEAGTDLPTMNWGVRGLAMAGKHPASYSVPKPY